LVVLVEHQLMALQTMRARAGEFADGISNGSRLHQKNVFASQLGKRPHVKVFDVVAFITDHHSEVLLGGAQRLGVVLRHEVVRHDDELLPLPPHLHAH
jgi:hypothetical protein